MATITLPYTITNGQTTDATKLMADLNAIVTEVNGNLESVNIKDLAVITAKLNDLAVTTEKLNNLAVTAAKIATDAVETLKIKDANVTAAKIATDAVETLKIKNANVTAAKLATDSVETVKIKDANVTAAKLATDSVETLKIKDANVTAGKLANDAVETLKIKDLNVTAGKLATGVFTEDKIGADAVTNSKIADDAVQAENILGLTGTGTVNIDNVPDGATYRKVSINYVDSNQRIVSILAGSLRVSCKYLEIGDWNMDSTGTVQVAHGLDATKIISVTGKIRSNVGTSFFPFGTITDTADPYLFGVGIELWDSTYVLLTRRTGSNFDSPQFNGTGYSRGRIFIWYEA